MKYIETLMQKKHLTRSDLHKMTGIPESTLRDILSGKARIERCETLTLVLIASVLDTTVEEILMNHFQELDSSMKNNQRNPSAPSVVMIGNCSPQKLIELMTVAFGEEDTI